MQKAYSSKAIDCMVSHLSLKRWLKNKNVYIAIIIKLKGSDRLVTGKHIRLYIQITKKFNITSSRLANYCGNNRRKKLCKVSKTR